MKIKELIFQGIMGQRAPVRVEFRDGVVDTNFPQGVDMSSLMAIFTALFYPSHLSNEDRQRLEVGRDVKIAVSFEDTHNTYRILRRNNDESMRLQIREDGAFRDAVLGAKLEQLLIQKFHFPEYAFFCMLNFWKFDEPMPHGPEAFSMDALDERTRDIVFKYRLSLSAELLEDELKSLDGRIEEARQKLGEAVMIEDKLTQARAKYEQIAVAELSKEDVEVLRGRDERFEEFKHQLKRLEAEEEAEALKVEQVMPQRFWSNPSFLGGMLLTVVATVVSVVLMNTHRTVALANVIGLGMSAWVLLRYFNDLERANVYLVRLDSIKRRMVQIREKQAAFNERIDHILIHAGVDDEHALIERDTKSIKLHGIIEKLQERLEKERTKPIYHITRDELSSLTARQEEARAKRDELPDNLMTSYQLERDLRELGVDPELAANPPESSLDAQPFDRDAFTRLFEVARRGGLVVGGSLDEGVRKMWAKMCSHIFGKRFEAVELVQEGSLAIGNLTPDQIAMWSRTRAAEVHGIAGALALAIQVNLSAKTSALDAVILSDPLTKLSGDQAQKMLEVFQSAAKKSQLLICKFP